MYWKIESEPCERAERETGYAGRFVLHRHTDADGPHLDLRLETGESLKGWRVEAENLDGASWATEKAAHPLRWLENDVGLDRIDAGVYRWERQSETEAQLVLAGENETRRVRVVRIPDLPAAAVRAVHKAANDTGLSVERIGDLIRDGAAARERAIARLCGLGRELDGAAFDAAVWRKSLQGLTLEEIHGQLRAYEARFDDRFPAAPVSQPEPIPDDDADPGERAMAILRD